MMSLEEISCGLDFITENGARTLHIEESYGLKEGGPANFIVLDAGSEMDAYPEAGRSALKRPVMAKLSWKKRRQSWCGISEQSGGREQQSKRGNGSRGPEGPEKRRDENMAVTCRDIMNLECCREIRLLAGAEGLDREVSWPYVKSMDTISEWIHGGELVFVIGFREDVSEKGLLELLDEAVRCGIAGLVLLYGGEYIKCVPKSARAYAEKRGASPFPDAVYAEADRHNAGNIEIYHS